MPPLMSTPLDSQRAKLVNAPDESAASMMITGPEPNAIGNCRIDARN
jgi:hypothetical protein